MILKKGQARKVLKAFGEDATEMLDANIIIYTKLEFHWQILK